jgi:hypothetical protein
VLLGLLAQTGGGRRHGGSAFQQGSVVLADHRSSSEVLFDEVMEYPSLSDVAKNVGGQQANEAQMRGRQLDTVGQDSIQDNCMPWERSVSKSRRLGLVS